MAVIESAQKFAFKEWAVVCAALGAGRQSLILRKGGIHEGRDGFRVAHRQFWLFPTGFHQQSDVIIPAAQPILDQILRDQPGDGEIWLQHYVSVEHVLQLDDESQIARLRPFHIWSEKTIQDRFHYRAPGLYALIVRVFRLPEVVRVADLPQFAGCRSWVELSQGIATADLVPVLPDDVHDQRVRQLLGQFS